MVAETFFEGTMLMVLRDLVHSLKSETRRQAEKWRRNLTKWISFSVLETSVSDVKMV